MSSGEWTFAMVDLAGFTALTEAHGNEHAADIATDFADLARASLGPGDQFVKALGDAVLLASPNPDAGLRLVQRILYRCHAREQYLMTRSALHHGPATKRGDDFFGAAVNLTARLAAHAAGGQVLGTSVIAQAARAAGIGVEDLGEARFKNVAAPTAIHALAFGTTAALESVDPVCRMRVDHHTAIGFLRVDGTEHWFCSTDCAATFLRDQNVVASHS